MIRQLSEEPNQRASHKIDGQGAEGKLDALAQLLSIAAHQVTEDGADESACADEK